MNHTEVFEQQDLIDGPGVMLRRLREAKGLDVEAVAAMLHLSEFKINAIEADDFGSLPEPVFVRGYLKNYARLLEVPEAPVLDAYSKFGFGSEIPEQVLVESDAKIEVSGDHDLVKIISVAVVVAIIVVPLVLWWDDLGQAVQKIVSTQEISQPELAIPVPLDSKEEAVSSISIPLPNTSDTEVISESPVVDEEKERKQQTLELEPEQKPVVSAIKPLESSETEIKLLAIPQQPVVEEIKPEPEPIKLSAPKPVVKAVSPASVPKPTKPVPKPSKPVSVTKGVWFNFVESGWVKVRDAENRVILIGEHKKGARKRLRSIMPYKVVLGNSKAVQVEIDGKVADVDRYSSGGVARFTINDGKIDKP